MNGCAKGVPMYELRVAADRCAGDATRTRLKTPDDVAAFILALNDCAAREHVHALYLDTRNELLGVQEISVGGLTQALTDPRVVFAPAVAVGASAIILTHNHPSGDPEPSEEDIVLTRTLVRGARYLGIRVLDHLVLAQPDRYVSLFARRPNLFDISTFVP